MSNLLVTGGAGFIGANFVHYWLGKYPADKVVVLDALTYAGNEESLQPVVGNDNYVFVEGDIGDQALVESLLVEYKLDTIVNFAAESHVDRSISGPDVFIETNIVGTHNLLKAARQVWMVNPETANPNHRFHHVSTDEVYGTLGDNDPAFTEDHAYAPNSPYSASKAASDHIVRAYHHTFGLNVTTSNCSNNYGPYQFPEKLIPLCLSNILANKALPIYGTGKNIRDWLYVEDHARGIDLILKQDKLGEVYNIGGHNEWTNIDIVKLLCEIMDKKFAADSTLAERYPDATPANGKKSIDLITYVEDRAGHDWRYAIDAEKSQKELGYKPAETFETGIEKTIDWYLDNPEWWAPLLKA
ncbi:dTDP-glucose 4,6-dehydratase [Leucothrix sargassi]|nr:dTDP-glucose 4,6-dehydratase [Leucothrix sargassi]